MNLPCFTHRRHACRRPRQRRRQPVRHHGCSPRCATPNPRRLHRDAALLAQRSHDVAETMPRPSLSGAPNIGAGAATMPHRGACGVNATPRPRHHRPATDAAGRCTRCSRRRRHRGRADTYRRRAGDSPAAPAAPAIRSRCRATAARQRGAATRPMPATAVDPSTDPRGGPMPPPHRACVGVPAAVRAAPQLPAEAWHARCDPPPVPATPPTPDGRLRATTPTPPTCVLRRARQALTPGLSELTGSAARSGCLAQADTRSALAASTRDTDAAARMADRGPWPDSDALAGTLAAGDRLRQRGRGPAAPANGLSPSSPN